MIKKAKNKKRISSSKLPSRLLNDIRGIIVQARTNINIAINAEMTMLYWNHRKKN